MVTDCTGVVGRLDEGCYRTGSLGTCDEQFDNAPLELVEVLEPDMPPPLRFEH